MKIADNIELDIDRLHGQRTLLQGASGSGKSTAARVILESTYGAFQHIIIDVEDEFHTLRTADREYAIIGGDHGDAPLTTKQDAGDLAQTLLKIGVNVVLQIGDWTLHEKRAFIGAFVAGMMHAKSDLWHPVIVMLDETHNWVPQSGVVDSSEAVTHLATAGRKRGYGAIFASQRISLINKDVMGQCENKFLGRIEQSADRRAVADLLGFSPRAQEAIDMQSFRPGEFYVVGPALAQVPTRARLYKAATEAPKPGTTVLPSATPAAISKALAALAAASEPTAEATAGKDASPSAAAQPDPEWIASIEKRGYDAGYAQGVDDGLKQGYANGRGDAGRRVLEMVQEFVIENADAVPPTIEFRDNVVPEDVAAGIKKIMAGTKAVLMEPMTIQMKPPAQHAADHGVKLGPSSRKIVEAIVAAFPLGMTLERAAKRSGLSQRSSAFRKYLKEAAADPRIEQRVVDGPYFAKQADSSIAAPIGLAAFKEKLQPSWSRMLETLEDEAGALTRDEIADRSGVSRTSSGLNAGLKELVALGLIQNANGWYNLSPDFR